MLLVRDLLDCFGESKDFHLYAREDDGAKKVIYEGQKSAMPERYKDLKVCLWWNDEESSRVMVLV